MSLTEIWKDIKEYEGFYQISNLGRVKSCTRIINNHLLRGYIRSPRLKNGYLRISLQKSMKRKEFGVHILVAKEFLENKENKPIVNHKDGNKLNNNLDNLEWVTYIENSNHAHNNGLVKYNTNITRASQEDEDNEIWRKINGVYDIYEVSNKGRIRRGSFIRKQVLSNGYFRTNLSKNNKLKSFYIHILVAETFISNIPENFVVNHKDGNKLNNNLDNLEIISQQENVVHAYKNNLINTRRGSAHQNSKITEEDAYEIFRLRKEGKTQKEIGQAFGISREQARDIINRKRWKHLNIEGE